MLNLRITTKPNNLEMVINDALSSFGEVTIGTPEYTKKVDELTKLYKLKEMNSHGKVSADTLAIVAGNLLGIVMILSYERAHVITTKALGFVMKSR
jgi:hypothetical protein